MALYNLGAEQSILGAILIEPELVSVGNQFNLSVYDFFHPQHQIIYKHMQKLYERNEKIDPVTLSSVFDKLGNSRSISIKHQLLYQNRQGFFDETKRPRNACDYIEKHKIHGSKVAYNFLRRF